MLILLVQIQFLNLFLPGVLLAIALVLDTRSALFRYYILTCTVMECIFTVHLGAKRGDL